MAMRHSNRIAEQDVGPPGQLAEPARRDKELAMRFGFWKLFPAFVLLLIAVYLVNPLGVPSLDPRLRLFGIAPFNIPAGSMAPTLVPGDVILVSVWPYRFGEPQLGDLVVFLHPKTRDIMFVKRLIGMSGERVVIHSGKVFINGKTLDEPYVMDDLEGAQPKTTEMEERLVPEGELFMLGDNRNNSNDSRYWGTVKRERLLAKAYPL